ncbi:UvrD-helicase domain-containing protein [Acetobacter persici]|uniref:UvrD-helicase domain-containing protein n=1 Tax=Acetobacter persici TaxID=1076596 RepID=UPI0020CF91D8|nr:UvrD-helicase domain-containing protein [Acetobacter persici]MCP9319080.1 UvrD-helicase domain-containing protein [Acetobacter persici]
MKTIVITENALVIACHPDFPLEALLADNPPTTFGSAFFQSGETSLLIATKGCNDTSRLLVIGEGSKGFFDLLPVDDHATLFERCVRVGLRSFDKQIALNPNWMPYRQDNRTSLFATGSSDLRILAETNYGGSRNTYVYDLLKTVSTKDLHNCEPVSTPYLNAIAEFSELLAKGASITVNDSGSVVLDHIVSESIAKGFAYDEWLPLLSLAQRDFVDRDIVGPLRVRGAAGTGKTLAMVMKVLKIAKDAGENPKRILFLTHSWAMAGQIDEMIRSIGRDIPTASLVDVYPLLTISNQRDYSAIGRRSLGLDSDSGKRDALKIISTIVDQFVASDWVAYRSGCSPSFVEQFEALPNSDLRRNLSWDILVEFGCVLAAQGMLGRDRDRERYMRVRRVGYMMPIVTSTEREVIFRLWVKFLAHLKAEGLIAADQIVSDYLNALQTFYWEAKREKEGYDYVFVDEMHLFNAQERLVFHNLLADGDAVPKVVLALDPKQSPREVFAEIVEDRDKKNNSVYARAGLPNPEKVDFVEIYRYTNEISILAKAVIDTVPALDMGEDWDIPGGSSVIESGPTPVYYLEQNTMGVFKRAMKVAKKQQFTARKRGGQVAILCMDYEKFHTYQNAATGQYPRDVFVIKSRDDVEQLRYMNRRIVFSTPEYVAGLQFDSVVLADVNGDLVPDTNYKGHQERRFLSELYLGISRAQRELTLIASKDSEGLTPYLQRQEEIGNLKRA